VLIRDPWKDQEKTYGCAPPATTPATASAAAVEEDMAGLLDQSSPCRKCGSTVLHVNRLECHCKQGVFYCGEECMKVDWREHKLYCIVELENVLKEAHRRQLEGDEEQVPLKDKANAHLGLGDHHRKQGRLADAEQSYLKALELYTEAFGEGTVRIGVVSESLGHVYAASARYDSALRMYKKALDVFRSKLNHGHDLKSELVCRALLQIGQMLCQLGRYEEALSILGEAHTLYEDMGGPDHPKVADSLTFTGNCFHSTGRLDRALSMHMEALRIRRLAHGENSEEAATSLANIGFVYLSQDNFEEAHTNFQQAHDMLQRVYGEVHPKVACLPESIAPRLDDMGFSEEARVMYDYALRIKCAFYGEDHMEVAHLLSKLGTHFRLRGQNKEALEALDKSLAVYTTTLGECSILPSLLGENAAMRAAFLYDMALAKHKSGDVTDAVKLAMESVQIYTETFGDASREALEAGNLLFRLRVEEGRKKYGI
jgi:tetratricopeptide (TPR) repeat protein